LTTGSDFGAWVRIGAGGFICFASGSATAGASGLGGSTTFTVSSVAGAPERQGTQHVNVS
jgi:hypothetical protein